MNSSLPVNCYIRVIQHNVNNQDIAQQIVLQQALTTHADIVLIQEPHLLSRKTWITTTHTAFHLITPQPSTLSDTTVRPRVLAYVRKTCTVEFTPRYDLCNDPDMQIIEFFGVEPFYVINVYNEKQQATTTATALMAATAATRATTAVNSPQRSTSLASKGIDSSNGLQQPQQRRYTTQRLLQHIRPDKPAIIAGDFNLHHPRWNAAADRQKASRAADFVSWLDNEKATLLINSEEVNLRGGTFHRSNLKSTSIIDLAFYTSFRKLV